MNNQPQKIKPVLKYEVEICNWFGCGYYKCESFKIEGNTFFLYDRDDTLLAVLIATEGYTISVSKND